MSKKIIASLVLASYFLNSVSVYAGPIHKGGEGSNLDSHDLSYSAYVPKREKRDEVTQNTQHCGRYFSRGVSKDGYTTYDAFDYIPASTTNAQGVITDIYGYRGLSHPQYSVFKDKPSCQYGGFENTDPTKTMQQAITKAISDQTVPYIAKFIWSKPRVITRMINNAQYSYYILGADITAAVDEDGHSVWKSSPGMVDLSYKGFTNYAHLSKTYAGHLLIGMYSPDNNRTQFLMRMGDHLFPIFLDVKGAETLFKGDQLHKTAAVANFLRQHIGEKINWNAFYRVDLAALPNKRIPFPSVPITTKPTTTTTPITTKPAITTPTTTQALVVESRFGGGDDTSTTPEPTTTFPENDTNFTGLSSADTQFLETSSQGHATWLNSTGLENGTGLSTTPSYQISGAGSDSSWSTGAIVGVTVGAGVAVLAAGAAAVLGVYKWISSKRKLALASGTRSELIKMQTLDNQTTETTPLQS
jgi:hypothetical protein